MCVEELFDLPALWLLLGKYWTGIFRSRNTCEGENVKYGKLTKNDLVKAFALVQIKEEFY